MALELPMRSTPGVCVNDAEEDIILNLSEML